jgi:replicative DNA helicase
MTLAKLYNVEAEQGLLGAILYNPDCATLVGELKHSDFAVPEHCEIFAWIAREVSEGRKPAAVSLVVTLGDMKVGPVDGRTYIARLASQQSGYTVRECLAQVKAFAGRRALLGVSEVVAKEVREATIAPKDTALSAIEALNSVIAMSRKASPAPQMVADAARDLVDTLDDPDDGSLISTGLKTLDRFMGGWPRGELSIVAGRPSMGKSAVLSAMARRGAARGLNFLIFSLEMPRRALAARMLSDFAFQYSDPNPLSYADILKKRVHPMQKQRLASALECFRGYAIKIDDQRGLTMPEIQLRAAKHADELSRAGERLDVIMVDHIGKIRASDRYSGNITAETGEKSDALMNLAFESQAAVVAAHQLNRGTEGREDKHPTPADLRDSGNLEQDAHTLVFPYRQAYYLERQKLDDPKKDEIRLATLRKKQNVMELLVAKCRNGACGTVEVFVDMPTNHVEDLLHEAQM